MKSSWEHRGLSPGPEGGAQTGLWRPGAHLGMETDWQTKGRQAGGAGVSLGKEHEGGAEGRREEGRAVCSLINAGLQSL